MTRIKEAPLGSEDIPEYKSPLNRIVHSLRKGYDNARIKIAGYRNDIKKYQIKVRDLEKSRTRWKIDSKKLEDENAQLKKEIENLTKKNNNLKKKHPK